MTAAPRYRPPHQPPRAGNIFVMNTGTTRKLEGDWTIVMPDGTREPWKGRGHQPG